jgi:flavin reductase
VSDVAPVTASEYRQGMRHLPAGVCLITTGRAPHRGGLTATAVMSLTAEPPQLVVAINRAGGALSLIASNRVFAVNVLGAADIALAEVFAGRTNVTGDDRFGGGDWIELSTSSPILSRAVVSFDCSLAQQMHVATHTLLVGSVEAIHMGTAGDPLLHCNGDWANLTSAVRYNGFVDELELMTIGHGQQ